MTTLAPWTEGANTRASDLTSMNGYQVAQRLRTDVGLTSSLLAAVTGDAQERDRVYAQQVGLDHDVAKPLDIATLAALLSTSK